MKKNKATHGYLGFLTFSIFALLLDSGFSSIVGAWAATGNSAVVRAPLELKTAYHRSSEAVTTEKIQDLDPGLLNPHRQKWVLERRLQLKGLEAIRLNSRTFGVKVKSIESEATGYLRGAGPWFQSLNGFHCAKTADPRFGTEEGAGIGVDAAAAEWVELLKREKPLLEKIMNKVFAPSSEAALQAALRGFDSWLRQIEKTWHGKGLPLARAREWDFYRNAAKTAKLCLKATESAESRTPLSWEDQMEPLSTQREGDLPLARAPARRWSGYYSVRVDVQVGKKILNGQFLIDPGNPRSALNPSWIKGQGVLPALIENPEVSPEKPQSTKEGGQEVLAPLGTVDRVSMSGFQLDLHDFLIMETDWFYPPENRSICCDGVLGADFLRKYVVQFYPGPSSEVRIWPRNGYHPLPIADHVKSNTGLELTDPVWLEASVAEKGPIQGAWAGAGVDGKTTAHANLKTTKELFRRGPLVLDLPHGRLWLPQAEVHSRPGKNNSGLSLAYVRHDGDRLLKVIGIASRSAAEHLKQQGLKIGTEILRVDSKPASELDLWQVDQILTGADGETVLLEWPVKGGVKMATVRVRE